MALFKKSTVICITILAISTAYSYASAAESVHRKQSFKVEMKCHVELMGGENVIHFTVIKKNKAAKLSQFLVGRKILTDSSKKKKVIYKVKECVDSKDSFNKHIARNIERKMAR
jgi:hypothetical protein